MNGWRQFTWIWVDLFRLVIFQSVNVFQGCILINSESHRGMTFGDALEFCEGLDPTKE